MLSCPHANVVLWPLSKPPQYECGEGMICAACIHAHIQPPGQDRHNPSAEGISEFPFLHFCSWEDRKGTIHDWQQCIDQEMEQLLVCAVCAWNITRTEVVNVVKPHKLDFSLLINDCLPEHVLLDTYTPEAYEMMEIDHVICLFKAEHKIDLSISCTLSTFSPHFSNSTPAL